MALISSSSCCLLLISDRIRLYSDSALVEFGVWAAAAEAAAEDLLVSWMRFELRLLNSKGSLTATELFPSSPTSWWKSSAYGKLASNGDSVSEKKNTSITQHFWKNNLGRNFFFSLYTEFLPHFCVFFSSPRKKNLSKSHFSSSRWKKNYFFPPKVKKMDFSSL